MRALSFSKRKEPASAPQRGHPPAAGPEKRQALFEGSAAAEASLAGARSKALVGLRGAKP